MNTSIGTITIGKNSYKYALLLDTDIGTLMTIYSFINPSISLECFVETTQMSGLVDTGYEKVRLGNVLLKSKDGFIFHISISKFNVMTQ